MSKKRLLARPKGKKFYPVSITLSQEQIDYLQQQPNASEVVRKILDDLIASENMLEQKMSLISLNNQIKQLEVKLGGLRNERSDFLRKNYNHWQKEKNDDGTLYRDDQGNCFLKWIDQGHTPIPEDTDDAKVAFKVLQEYDKAVKVVEEEIVDLKNKILRSE